MHKSAYATATRVPQSLPSSSPPVASTTNPPCPSRERLANHRCVPRAGNCLVHFHLTLQKQSHIQRKIYLDVFVLTFFDLIFKGDLKLTGSRHREKQIHASELPN